MMKIQATSRSTCTSPSYRRGERDTTSRNVWLYARMQPGAGQRYWQWKRTAGSRYRTERLLESLLHWLRRAGFSTKDKRP